MWKLQVQLSTRIRGQSKWLKWDVLNSNWHSFSVGEIKGMVGYHESVCCLKGEASTQLQPLCPCRTTNSVTKLANYSRGTQKSLNWKKECLVNSIAYNSLCKPGRTPVGWSLPTGFCFATSIQGKFPCLKSHILRKLEDVKTGIFLPHFKDGDWGKKHLRVIDRSQHLHCPPINLRESAPCPLLILVCDHRGYQWAFFFFFKYSSPPKHFIIFLNLFIFGCIGSSLLRAGLSLVAASGGYSSLRYAGFSLQWLLLLRNTGSRRMGFSSCGTQAQ